MLLIELLCKAADWADGDVIYVCAPWSPDADAVFVVAEGSGTESVDFQGRQYDYFLETFIARDFLEDYATSLEGASATERGRCERLIKYALNDA
jgi:hypothetical protein